MFSAPLTVTQRSGSKWEIVVPFRYEADNSDVVVVIPQGYMSDFASVPRPFRWLFPRSGEYNQAAVVHDWCYTDGHRRFSRKQADKIFLYAMEELGVSCWKRVMMYAAVRLGGPRHYWS